MIEMLVDGIPDHNKVYLVPDYEGAVREEESL
jgi:hypothetical protein